MLAAYYGLVSHIDNQISRFLTALEEFDLDKNTIIWFVSDHGDQLGEHYLFRKAYPYQGSIKVPSFIYDPGNIIAASHKTIKQLVKLQDIFPSLVDLALGEHVEVDGKSVKQLLFGHYEGWRQDFHGEHSKGVDSCQFILTQDWKFIWYPVKNEYQLFHMPTDPNEMKNLISEESYAPVIEELTAKLVQYLQNRPEGFVKDGQLHQVPVEAIRATLYKEEA